MVKPIDTNDFNDKRNQKLDANFEIRKKNTANRKPSLLDALEIEEGSHEDINTSIAGKIKENVDIKTITEMTQAFIKNHPEKKEKLLKTIQQEIDITLQL